MAKKRESGLGRGLDALMGVGPASLLEDSEGGGRHHAAHRQGGGQRRPAPKAV